MTSCQVYYWLATLLLIVNKRVTESEDRGSQSHRTGGREGNTRVQPCPAYSQDIEFSQILD